MLLQKSVRYWRIIGFQHNGGVISFVCEPAKETK